MSVSIKDNSPGRIQAKAVLHPIIIIGALFFIYGFVTWLNSILIPYFKIACELKSDAQSFLVATAFFIAYTVMAIPSSYVLKKTGYKKGMSLGLLIMAAGALLFVPAAQSRSYDMFLVGLFVIGTGLALLQTASNPYVSMIGPIESAASRISIMGICNKTAGIIASLIFGYIALKDTDQMVATLQTKTEAEKNVILNELAARVINPYIIIAAVLIVFTALIYFSSLPDIKEEEKDSAQASKLSAGKSSIFQFPHLLFGVLAIFLYVGVEVMAGDTIISYGRSLGIEMSKAKFFTSATLACMLIGYIIGIFTIPKYISQQNALKYCAMLGVLFTGAALLTSGYTSVLFIALLGLANSLMWPAIFPLAINGLGKFIKIGSALLIMGIAGGAILPLIYGAMMESSIQHSIAKGVAEGAAKAKAAQQSYWIMIPCYLFIGYYAVSGYKLRKK